MLNQIKINYTDFYGDKNYERNPFHNFLSSHFNLELSEEPDFLIHGVYGQDYLNYNCVRILYSAENMIPDFKTYDYSLTFCKSSFQDRNWRVPLYAVWNDLSIQLDSHLGFRNATNLSQNRDVFCSFVVSNPYCSFRNNLFKRLEKYKFVHSGGGVFNNSGGKTGNKLHFIRNSKFNIACENQSYPGYTTEKILEAFLAGCIPVYWGNPEIAHEFNEKAFINCHNYKSINEVADRIIEIDQNKALYLDYLSQPIFYNDTIPDDASHSRIVTIFNNIFYNTRPSRIACSKLPSKIFNIKKQLKKLAGKYSR